MNKAAETALMPIKVDFMPGPPKENDGTLRSPPQSSFSANAECMLVGMVRAQSLEGVIKDF
jgi:hypothetical protein